MSKLRFALGMIFASIATLGPVSVFGQDYPNKTIRLITSPPGGGGDILSRQIAQGISGPLGQVVIVDNRQVNIIGETLAKSPPDGYTVVVLGGILWLTPLMQKTAYDPVRDFAPISLLVTQPNVLVVQSALPVKSVKELIAYAKAKPGALTYGTSGVGGSPQLAAELFKSMTGTNIVGVNYKAAAPVVTGLLGGEVQVAFISAPSIAPHIKSGALRALAVTSAQPSALAPDLPTIAASGLPGFEIENRTAMFAPAKTPVAIINRLNREVVRAISTPEAKERFLSSGSEVVASTPQELGAHVKSEMALIGKVIKDAGIKTE